MQCIICGQVFSPIEYHYCPSCHHPAVSKGAHLCDALKWIVDTHGINVFSNSNFINSTLADLVKQEESERKKIQLALSSGAGMWFLSLYDQANGIIGEIEIKQFLQKLKDTGFADDFSSFITSTFMYAVSLAETMDTQHFKANEASESGTNDLQSKEDERRIALNIHFENAKKYYENNRYDLAKQEIDICIQNGATEESIYHYASLIYYQLKDYEHAIDYISKCIFLDRPRSKYYGAKASYQLRYFQSLRTKDDQKAKNVFMQSLDSLRETISLCESEADAKGKSIAAATLARCIVHENKEEAEHYAKMALNADPSNKVAQMVIDDLRVEQTARN